MTTETVQRSAVISDDGLYRYRLDRWWGDGARVVWVMLNPSTADADEDDPTIRRVMRFSRDWGYDGCTVVNLYPLRATKPADLRRWLRRHVIAPAMIENAKYVERLTVDAPLTIAAWGAHADPDDVLPPPQTWCHLGITPKTGQPRHPLFVPASTKPSPFAPGGGVPKP